MESLHKSTLLHHGAPSNGQICCQLKKTSTNVTLISPLQIWCFSKSQHKQIVSKNKLIQVFLKDAKQICHGVFPSAVSAKINYRFSDLSHGSYQVAETKQQSHEGHAMHAAFVNGERNGCIPEMPFQLNSSIANEHRRCKAKKVFNVKEEILLVERMRESFDLQSTAFQTMKMKKLGFQRAKLHGWQDTYVFTKAMGEMLIGHERGNVPVVIVRPSVVESTLMQPFSGWMEGIRMLDPIAIAYGKGLANAFLADPKGVLDVIPADMVVNATLAAMAKHARQPGLTVYHIGSSVVNPLIFERLVDLMYQHFRSHPFVDQNGVPILTPKLRLFKDKISFRVFNYLNCDLPRRLGRYLPWSKKNISEKRKILFDSAAQQITHLLDIYTPYTFYKGRFDISNTKILHTELSPAERIAFGFEVSSIDWDHYMKNVHFPGLRKYALRGRNTTTRL